MESSFSETRGPGSLGRFPEQRARQGIWDGACPEMAVIAPKKQTRAVGSTLKGIAKFGAMTSSNRPSCQASKLPASSRLAQDASFNVGPLFSLSSSWICPCHSYYYYYYFYYYYSTTFSPKKCHLPFLLANNCSCASPSNQHRHIREPLPVYPSMLIPAPRNTKGILIVI